MVVRSDHSSNTKRGSVFPYYKNNLALRVVNIVYLSECLTFELKVGNKTCFIDPQAIPKMNMNFFLDNFEMTSVPNDSHL